MGVMCSGRVRGVEGHSCAHRCVTNAPPLSVCQHRLAINLNAMGDGAIGQATGRGCSAARAAALQSEALLTGYTVRIAHFFL